LGQSALGAPFLASRVNYRDSQRQAPSDYNAAFDQIFSKSGYRTVKTSGQLNPTSMIGWLNRIYFRPLPSAGRVFVKSGLQVNGLVEFGKVYELKANVYVAHLHGAVGTQSDTVFFFDHMSEQAAVEIIKSASRINAQTAGYNADYRLRALNRTLASASAADGVEAESTVGSTAVSKAAAPGTSSMEASFAEDSELDLLEAKDVGAGKTGVNYFCSEDPIVSYGDDALALLEKSGDCIGNFTSGVWASTGALVWGAIELGHDFYVRPGETYENCKKSIRDIGAFVANLDTYAGQFCQDFKSLPLNSKVQIACEVAGNLGSSAVVAALTAGIGSSALAANLAAATAKVAALSAKAKDAVLTSKLAKAAQSMKEAASAAKLKQATSAETAADSGKKAAELNASLEKARAATFLAASAEQVKKAYNDLKAAGKGGKSSKELLEDVKKLEAESESTLAESQVQIRRYSELYSRDPESLTSLAKRVFSEFNETTNALKADLDIGTSAVNVETLQGYLVAARNAAAKLKKVYALTPGQEAALGQLEATIVELKTKAQTLSSGGHELKDLKTSAELLGDRLNQMISTSTGEISHLREPSEGFLSGVEKTEMHESLAKIESAEKK